MGKGFCHAGAGSDADKVVEYRAFARMRRAFPQAYTSYEMGNFSRFMIKAGDHPVQLLVHTHCSGTVPCLSPDPGPGHAGRAYPPCEVQRTVAHEAQVSCPSSQPAH